MKEREMDKLFTSAGDRALAGLTYSAKIDFVTLETPRKLPLPVLIGKPKWSAKNHYRRLSIHDAQLSDLATLEALYGPMRLLELEIAVDIRAHASLSPAECEIRYEQVMIDQFAKQLEPSAGTGMKGHARTTYRRLGLDGKIAPFNKRLPLPTDQQLHGWRHDDVQVKAYWKKVDQGRDLAASQHGARVEVRLGPGGLLLHGLTDTADLQHFRFRKCLMPYFRHVRGVRPPMSKHASPMLKLLWAKGSEINKAHFDAVGVGAFLQGGLRSHSNTRHLRNTEVNDRIGQALLRLERRSPAKKFVRR
jgi:hypothetical protein